MDISEPSLQLDPNSNDESSDVLLLSLSQTRSSSSMDCSTTSTTDDYVPRTVREKFYTNVKVHDANWSAQCTLCDKVQYDKRGVTSNINRHVKRQHKKEYVQWLNKVDQLKHKNQKKMSDMFMKNNGKSHQSISTLSYTSDHPRQIELSQLVVENLIIELGLPVSIVEQQGFIKFMNKVDPKFMMNSRRTLCRSTIPRLFDSMNDSLKKFCLQSQFISLTLDIWSDRRLRTFFAMTGMINILYFLLSSKIRHCTEIARISGHAFVDGSLKSYVLSFLSMYGSHTANSLLQTYENAISMFDIEKKLVRLVTDNASNNVKAFEKLIIPGFESYFNCDNEDDEENSDNDQDRFFDDNESDFNDSTTTNDGSDLSESIKISFDNIASCNESLRIPCFAHTIQLVVRDGLKEISFLQSALAKVSKIVRLSHTSTTFAEKLEQIGKSIPTANKTRWNSQFDTVEKTLRIASNDLNEMLVSVKQKDLCLLTKDYQILNEFVSLLTLFAEATTIIQSEHTPSISLVGPTILSIYFDLLNEKPNVVFTSSLCQTLINSLVARFGGLLEEIEIDIDHSIKKKNTYALYKDPLFIYAPFLDGKFKLSWIMESPLPTEKKTRVCEKIKRLVYDYCILLHHDMHAVPRQEINVVPSGETTTTTSKSTTPKRKSLFSSIENKSIKRAKIDNYSFIKDEINNYLHDDTTDRNRFLLISGFSQYKSLSTLAKKVLSVPATSAPVERIFSQSGFIFRQHRAKMSRKILQMLTMLKCNKDLI